MNRAKFDNLVLVLVASLGLAAMPAQAGDSKKSKAQKYVTKTNTSAPQMCERSGDAIPTSEKNSNSDRYSEKARKYAREGNTQKSARHAARAKEYASRKSDEAKNADESKAKKYSSKAERRAGEGDLEAARKYAAKAKKYAVKDADPCWPEVRANFSMDGYSVTATSAKDLSNVVLLFADGATQRYEGLTGYEQTFAGSGANLGKFLTGIWVKSGCNHSGDGPGYGQFVENEPMINFIPVVSISDAEPVVEGNGESLVQSFFAVTLSEAVPAGAGPVTVEYITVGYSAISDWDFVSQSGSVTFQPGEISQTVVIDIVSDTDHDSYHEYFYVDLIDATSAQIGQNRGIGTIIEDESDDY